MIKSIGIDLVEIQRMKNDVERFGERFLNRILGAIEIEQYYQRHDKEHYLAGRFAAKEAVIKGLGQYLTVKPPFNQIQIVNNQSGQPELLLPDDIKKNIGSAKCLISITHEKKYAAAVAVFTEEK